LLQTFLPCNLYDVIYIIVVSNNGNNNNRNEYLVNNKSDRSKTSLLYNIRATCISVRCNYHQNDRQYCCSQSVTTLRIFQPFLRKISLSYLFLLSELTIRFCCIQISLLLLRNVIYFNFPYACSYSPSCTTSVHIFSAKWHCHLTLNGRMCRLTMYFSLFLFCHAVCRLSCLAFQSASFIRNKQVYNFRLARLVDALRYKPEGRGFDYRWCHWNFLLTYKSADKSLARPGRKQATATEDFDVHISYL
jgi:hypothetical protein